MSITEEELLKNKKVCNCCHQEKDLKYFIHSSYKGKTVYRNKCRTCSTKTLHNRYKEYQNEYIFGHGSKRINKTFDMTEEEFDIITSQTCYYCGEYTEILNGKGYVGIDRIDSFRGYEKDNIVPCCKWCNIMKNDLSQEEFYQQINRIYNNSIRRDNNGNLS